MDRQALDRQALAMRARELSAGLAGRGVRAVALTWVDNAGVTRVKTVPVDRLPEAAAWGVGMSPVFDVFCVDDSITTSRHIGGPVGDLRLHPDLDRLTGLAAQQGWAWAPVDRWTQEGELYPACPGPAYGMTRVIEVSDYVQDLLAALAAEGVVVDQFHPEYATGQLELSVAPADPVGAADLAVLVRQTIRAVAARHGLLVSFAPVVVAWQVGNGGHLHFSVREDGRNLFAGGEGPHGMTARGESILAGVLARLPALICIGAPSPASYLRLVPQRWAGVFQCWGRENREAAVRFITGPAGNRETAANAELKCFDGAANPYLLAGAVTAIVTESVDAGLRLPPEVTVDPAELADADQPPRLPTSLPEAVRRLESDRGLSEALGPELFEAFLAVRRAETEQFADRVPEEVVAATRWVY